MFIKTVALAGGLAGAVVLSQFPEFSQQYTQRLAGAVNELSRVVESFDEDASEQGLTRQQALVDMTQAGGMAEARAESMQRVFSRYEKLHSDLSALYQRASVEVAAQFWRMSDPVVARKAWEDFKPAIPATLDGIGFGAAGFLLGLAVYGVLQAILRRILFRRRVQA